MKIGMFSTKRGRGLTTAAILLADMCAREYSLQCILAHTGTYDASMSRYLDLEKNKDVTMNIRQVYKLLEVDAIRDKDFQDYTIKRGNLGIFDIYSPNYKVEGTDDSAKLLNRVLGENRRGISFLDVTGELYDKESMDVLSNADYYIIVIDQSQEAVDKIELCKQLPYWKNIEKEGYLVLVNNYNKMVLPLDKMAKDLKIRRSKILKISYNPMIAKLANEGSLDNVCDYALENDPRFINVKTDLLDCVDIIAKNLGIIYKRK